MMHIGEMTKTFLGIGKEEQADIKPEDAKHATNVATFLCIDCEWMINYFCSKFLVLAPTGAHGVAMSVCS